MTSLENVLEPKLERLVTSTMALGPRGYDRQKGNFFFYSLIDRHLAAISPDVNDDAVEDGACHAYNIPEIGI